MDPINIIAGLNLLATFGANLGGAKKGLKSVVSEAKEKPVTYLQKIPLVISVLILISFIFGLFQIGTIHYYDDYLYLRAAGLIIYIIFSWLQVSAFKGLGDYYSQEVVVFKKHQIITTGLFKSIRHPQYVSEILMNIGAALLTLSIPVIFLLIMQIPFLILRARLEEKLLTKYFTSEYSEYKKKSGFFIPFIG
jgi:protein-S-isoprenylcysteine O-methyltransferase Ste14